MNGRSWVRKPPSARSGGRFRINTSISCLGLGLFCVMFLSVVAASDDPRRWTAGCVSSAKPVSSTYLKVDQHRETLGPGGARTDLPDSWQPVQRYPSEPIWLDLQSSDWTRACTSAAELMRSAAGAVESASLIRPLCSPLSCAAVRPAMCVCSGAALFGPASAESPRLDASWRLVSAGAV